MTGEAAGQNRNRVDVSPRTSELAGAILDHNNRAEPFKWTDRATHNNSHKTTARVDVNAASATPAW